LFERHGPTVLGLCRVLLRDAHEAEDAVQQTFLHAYRSLLRGIEPRHPPAWLATIARNECRVRIQRRMREPLVELELDNPLPDPVIAAAARADLAEIWCAIGELPRRQRRAFLLREFSGLSYAELGEALGLSEPAVESLLVRARRQLRIRLRPVFRSTVAVAPLVEIRNQLSRLIGDMPDPVAASSSGLARVAAVPLAAKFAAGAAAVVVAGGTVAAVEHVPYGEKTAGPPVQAAGAPRPAAKPPVPVARRDRQYASAATHERVSRLVSVVRARPATATVNEARSGPSPTVAAAPAPAGPAHVPAAPSVSEPAPHPAAPVAAPAPTGPAAGTVGTEPAPAPAAGVPAAPAAPAEPTATAPDEGGSTQAGESGSSDEGEGDATRPEASGGGDQNAGEDQSDGGGDHHDDHGGGDGESSGGD
jgi:RNA polymerase sigma-70 factor (ECF subfamily)